MSIINRFIFADDNSSKSRIREGTQGSALGPDWSMGMHLMGSMVVSHPVCLQATGKAKIYRSVYLLKIV